LTVYALYIFETIIYVRTSQTKIFSDNNHYHTRSNRYVQQHNLKFYEKKASFIGTKFLFSLPKNIRQEQNFKKFRNLLRNYLAGLSLYSLDEFWEMKNE